MARITRDVPGLGDWLTRAAFARGHRKATEAGRSTATTPPDIVDIQQAELGRRGFVPAILASLRGMLGADAGAEHRRIADAGLPVLAIWGRDDAVIPLAARDVLARWNPRARHVVIDGAGHGLPFTHAACRGRGDTRRIGRRAANLGPPGTTCPVLRQGAVMA